MNLEHIRVIRQKELNFYKFWVKILKKFFQKKSKITKCYIIFAIQNSLILAGLLVKNK